MATKIDKFIAEKTGMDPAEVQAKMQACLEDPSLRDHDFMKAVAEYMIAEGIGQGRDFNQFRMPDEKTLVQMGNRGIQQINSLNEAQHIRENATNDPSEQKKEAAPEETIQEKMARMRAEREAQREAYQKSRQKPAETKPPEQKQKEPEQKTSEQKEPVQKTSEQKEPVQKTPDTPQTLNEQLSELSKMKMDGIETRVGNDNAGERSYSGPTEIKANPESWALINEAGNLMAERFKEAGIDVDPHHFTYLQHLGNSEFSKEPMDHAQFQQAEAIMKQTLIDVGVSEDNALLFMGTMGTYSYEDAAPKNVAPTNDTPAFDNATIDEMLNVQKEVETAKVTDNEPPAVEDPTERWAKAKADFDPSQVHTGLTTDTPSNEGLEQFANSRMDALAAFADKFKNESSSILLGNKQGSVEMATTVIETASLQTSTTISNMTTGIEQTTSIERTANVDMTTSVTMNVQMPS